MTRLTRISPFGRVPVLDHDGFVLCETSAITRYLATAFPGPPLIPTDPKNAARMEQVIAIIDAHGYWPMVRQVFSHAVLRPKVQAPSDPAMVAGGLTAARPVLDQLATEGRVLVPGQLTLADLHLAPMLGYFAMAEQGKDAVQDFPALSGWWHAFSQHPAYLKTDPGLATLAAGA